MLGGCGNVGKPVTSRYSTTLQQMGVWICCIYQCIARVESKGTHRFMNPSKQGVEGNRWRGRTRREDPLSTKWEFQGQAGSGQDVHYKGRSLYKLLLWLFASAFWQDVLLSHSNGACAFGTQGVWSLVRELWVGSFQKWPCYLQFSKCLFVCLFVFSKTTPLLWIQIYLLQSA